MKTIPLVSVIVPFYNCEKTIAETIESICNQTYTRWELICVDDGSLDTTYEIVKSYTEKYDNIFLLQRDRLPKGGSTCRNLGLEVAKGEFVIFLDGDDLLSPSCIETRVNKTVELGNMDFTVFPMATFVESVEDAITYSDTKNHRLELYKYMFGAGFYPWQITSTFWRKDYLSKLGGFDEKYTRLQDIEIHLRATNNTNSFRFFTKSAADCFYRIPEKRKEKEDYMKYRIAIGNYPRLIHLVNNSSQHWDAKTLSIVYFSIIINIYITICLGKQNNSRDLFKNISKDIPVSKLLFTDRLLNVCTRIIFFFPKISLIFLKVLRRVNYFRLMISK